MSYDPATARYLCFADARRSFASGEGAPRAYLEQYLDRIAATEPEIKAFVCFDLDRARQAADDSDRRWRENRPLSVVDGLPVGIKDCFDVRGLPTEVNSPLFAGNTPTLDAAHVDALRRGGAIVVGKTVTTELTMGYPGPTWNPWDPTRTPGGSSSGSGAAVAAGMLPVATGSQVRGSVLRPASICGVVAMKPTYGALNHLGGFDPSPSLNHLGILAGTLTDTWEVARYLAEAAGPDPGFAPLTGSAELPPARKPERLARQYTPGWPKTDDASKDVFDGFLQALARHGIEIVEPDTTPELAGYEDATTRTPEFFFDLMLWESRWPLLAGRDAAPGAFSETVLDSVGQAEQLTVEDYRRAGQRREALRHLHRQLTGTVDGFITLAHIGPGQVGQPKRGTPWYNDASSAIGAPTFNLPLLSVEAVPLGVQIMGFEGRDEDLAAISRWVLGAFGSPAVGPG